MRGGAVAGVVLQDGRELDASLVVSSADPRRSLLELVEPGWLDPELARALRNVRRRGVAARLRLQLDRSPGFAALALAPSLDYLERAYDDAKYGRVSRQPYVEARCDERHRLDVHVQYAPYGADCSKLGEHVVALLSEHWGDARRSACELLSPRELEEQRRLAAKASRTTPSSPRPGALDAAAAGAGALPHADRGPVAVRRRACIRARASPAPRDSTARKRFFAAEAAVHALPLSAAAAAERLPGYGADARELHRVGRFRRRLHGGADADRPFEPRQRRRRARGRALLLRARQPLDRDATTA